MAHVVDDHAHGDAVRREQVEGVEDGGGCAARAPDGLFFFLTCSKHTQCLQSLVMKRGIILLLS